MQRNRLIIFVLALLVVVFLVLHVWIGSSLNLSPMAVIKAIAEGPPRGSIFQRDRFVLWELRMPRACGCVVVGALLGGVGSVFQALFRNPLADPFIVGASSGAAIGGVILLVAGVGGGLAILAIPAAGFAGGMLALVLVLAIATRKGVLETQNLLLAGVVTGACLSAGLSFALFWSGENANVILRWLMGSIDPMFWPRVGFMVVILVLGAIALIRQSRNLNALAISDEAAESLGVDVPRLRWTILLWGTAMTAAAVGNTGIIGFVGLIAPHIARRIVGVDWRFSLPASFLVGSSVLLVADIVAMRVVQDGLPVGIVTAIVGGPTLLWLLRQNQEVR